MRVLGSARVFVVALLSTLSIEASSAQALTKNAAVTVAQKFVVENGYTDAPRREVKDKLDPESLELSAGRDSVLSGRINTLRRVAIGIKFGAKYKAAGWSVAFDYVGGGPSPRNCRVVTMDEDGTNIRMQHVDGIRSYFAGFD
jgi:hypothetical protein